MIGIKNDEMLLFFNSLLFLRGKISILSILFFLSFRVAEVYIIGYTCIQKHIYFIHIYITCKETNV